MRPAAPRRNSPEISLDIATTSENCDVVTQHHFHGRGPPMADPKDPKHPPGPAPQAGVKSTGLTGPGVPQEVEELVAAVAAEAQPQIEATYRPPAGTSAMPAFGASLRGV